MENVVILNASYGSSKNVALGANECTLFTTYGFYGASYIQRQHISFILEPDTPNGFSSKWAAN